MLSTAPVPRAERSADPTFEPVSLLDAKKQVEIATSVTTHDAHLRRLITLAREQVEYDTGLVAATGTFTKSLDCWPTNDVLPIAERPVTSVTSIAYTDTDGNSQTWAASNYAIDTARNVIWRAYNISWPDTRADKNAITLTYVAGYADQASVPVKFKQAVLLRVSAAFYDRNGSYEQSAYTTLIHSMMRSSYP